MKADVKDKIKLFYYSLVTHQNLIFLLKTTQIITHFKFLILNNIEKAMFLPGVLAVFVEVVLYHI